MAIYGISASASRTHRGGSLSIGIAPAASFGPDRARVEELKNSRKNTGAHLKRFSMIACEMVRSVSAAVELQPSAIGSVVAPIREIVAREVSARGGAIREASGPAIIGLFQDQESEKDSCRRAVRSALGIQKVVTRFTRDTQSDGKTSPVSVRIGIVSGTIAEGSGKDDPSVDGVEIGNLIDLAVRVGRFRGPGRCLRHRRGLRIHREFLSF